MSAQEAYADSDTVPSEVQRLKDAFKDMSLKGNTKVTSERVFSMCVHPEKTKTLVLVGDKYGQLGMYVFFFCDKRVLGWFKADTQFEDGMLWARPWRSLRMKMIPVG